jgi:chemotaxis response regulator CheB
METAMRKLSYYRVIRILQVEGSDRHAERVRLHLYASGLRCAIQRVSSREDFESALKLRWPDIVLIGGGLPSLDALGAERLAMERSPYLPVVFAAMDHLAGLSLVVLGAMLQSREVIGRRVADFSHAQAARAYREYTRELPRLRATGTHPAI